MKVKQFLQTARDLVWWLREKTHNQEVESSNPGALICMDIFRMNLFDWKDKNQQIEAGVNFLKNKKQISFLFYTNLMQWQDKVEL